MPAHNKSHFDHLPAFHSGRSIACRKLIIFLGCNNFLVLALPTVVLCLTGAGRGSRFRYMLSPEVYWGDLGLLTISQSKLHCRAVVEEGPCILSSSLEERQEINEINHFAHKSNSEALFSATPIKRAPSAAAYRCW